MNGSISINHHYVTSLKTLTPHITCLAVHHNLLYAASLNLINVFDLSHYTQIDAFNESPASGFVKSIAFSGSRVFTAHQDCKIRVWLITPSKRHRLLSSLPTVKDKLSRCIIPRNYVTVRRHRKGLWIQHCDTVSGLAVNERLMYSVSWDKSFKIWDLTGYRCLESVKAHEDAINAVVVSDDGAVYTASADGCIKVWKRDDKAKRHVLVRTVGKHKPTVNALVLDGDGTALFSGGSDGTICRWETDRTVRIWQKERGSGGCCCCKAVLRGHEKPIKSLVAVSGGEEDDSDDSNGVVTIFSGSLDGDIKVWEVFGLV
ncbi:WD40/YVTN repeat-like-containing domain superfamily [Sesbania bispinosa]|nr:WD40/YVTN repeat-like-containing domain superfamily [Sesbania bispinosa]